MDIPQIDIELIRQTPETDDCLRACSMMLLNLFGEKYKKSYIWKKIKSYKKHSGLRGTYLTDVGLFFHKLGYSTQISHYDWSWWNEEVVQASGSGKKGLGKALHEYRKQKEWVHRKVIDKEIRYLDKGNIIFTPPNINTIDKLLINRIPPIVLVQAEYFFHAPKQKYNHAIIIVGKKGNDYLIKDPLYAVEKKSADELDLAWKNAGGWILSVKPMRAKGNQQQEMFNTGI